MHLKAPRIRERQAAIARTIAAPASAKRGATFWSTFPRNLREVPGPQDPCPG